MSNWIPPQSTYLSTSLLGPAISGNIHHGAGFTPLETSPASLMLERPDSDSSVSMEEMLQMGYA